MSIRKDGISNFDTFVSSSLDELFGGYNSLLMKEYTIFSLYGYTNDQSSVVTLAFDVHETFSYYEKLSGKKDGNLAFQWLYIHPIEYLASALSTARSTQLPPA